MADTQDYSKMMKDMMNAFPVDMNSMQDSFKSYAAFGEKMSRVALEAAAKSTEISSKWTQDTIGKMGTVTTVKEEQQDYSRAVTDFASQQAEMTTETMAAFAEIAKKVQMETVELMMAAGREASEDMTSAARKAQTQMTSGVLRTTDQTTGAVQKTSDQMADKARKIDVK